MSSEQQYLSEVEIRKAMDHVIRGAKVLKKKKVLEHLTKAKEALVGREEEQD